LSGAMVTPAFDVSIRYCLSSRMLASSESIGSSHFDRRL
jgi:hypothetical protein